MSDDSLGCCEETPNLALNSFTPFRDSTTTAHVDDGSKTIVAFTLPEDELSQIVRVSAIGRSADGSVRIGAIFDALVTRRESESPDYSLEKIGRSIFNNDDPDLEFDLIVNGGIRIDLTVTDESGDAGTLTWNYQIWVIEEIKLV